MHKRYSVPGLVMKERNKVSEPTEKIGMEICCRVGAVLKFHYPLHMWHVGIVGDLLYIKAMNLNRKLGFRMPVASLIRETDFNKSVMLAGGEILERYGVKRGKLTLTQHQSLNRDIAGNGIQT